MSPQPPADVRTPPGWPRAVQPAGAAGWQRTAVAWLLDHEHARLLATHRAVTLVGDALRGLRYVPRW